MAAFAKLLTWVFLLLHLFGWIVWPWYFVLAPILIYVAIFVIHWSFIEISDSRKRGI